MVEEYKGIKFIGVVDDIAFLSCRKVGILNKVIVTIRLDK